ncbi:hypothetical protein TSTA_085490 [Talaromyces stipitatus ATCC 10500]|uniref:Uncharacterized protein n=1 Tax=Talaromyces stipitatus (strain ATCC 10500 / CBS 375.48 / QM 6759 / NRRL 1006) TaxID=441959 RepID=B8M1U0_TALSN|nr:uncharacterized protein TSTA_085490 [Talaromyces stipitatus ATCC 10500]EED21318.1 hypothetical protein TSTA_085490 [Talaromyces stipitatus ATCC 10500]
MAEDTRQCSSCLVGKPINQFKSKTGKRLWKTKQDHRASKRKSNEPAATDPPAEETHIPHFIWPTAASLRRIAPQDLTAQPIQHQIQEMQEAQQPSPTPSQSSTSQTPSTPDPLTAMSAGISLTPDPLAFVGNEPVSPTLRRTTTGLSLLSSIIDPPATFSSLATSTLDPLAILSSGASTPVIRTAPAHFTLLPYKARRSKRLSSLCLTLRHPIMLNHFVCTICQTPRYFSWRIANGVNICEYCQNLSIPFEEQHKSCVSYQQDVPIAAFFDDKSNEHAHYNLCRASSIIYAETDLSYVPESSNVHFDDTPIVVSTLAQEYSEQDPPYIPGNRDALLQPALIETDFNYIKNFHKSLDKQQLEYC